MEGVRPPWAEREQRAKILLQTPCISHQLMQLCRAVWLQPLLRYCFASPGTLLLSAAAPHRAPAHVIIQSVNFSPLCVCLYNGSSICGRSILCGINEVLTGHDSGVVNHRGLQHAMCWRSRLILQQHAMSSCMRATVISLCNAN
jgi:hypothetical protein